MYCHRFLRFLLPLYHLLIGRTMIKRHRGHGGESNQIHYTTANLWHDQFIFRSGSFNTIEIDSGTSLEHSSITFKGSNNRVTIGKEGFINGLDIVLEGDNNAVVIGEHAFVLGDMRMVAVDGSAINIGNDCMFSDRIEIRTTDNHAIIDRETGMRINFEEDVVIGNHVWIGTGATILKGAKIADGCIVGAKSLVTRKHIEKHSVIAGHPGTVIRRNIMWTMER